MSKKCLIYETLNAVKDLSAQRGEDGLMHLSGVFGVCGVLNNNKRIYEKNNYAEMVKRLQKRIDEEGCPGELEHPNSMNITLENVSHKIDTISIDDNGVVTGTITLLNTPKGKIAQAIVEGGLPLFISSRANGVISKDGKVTLEDLKTYDLVGTPGFSQARLKLNENQMFESICENLCCIVDENEEQAAEEVVEETEITNNENTSENNEIDEMEQKELLEKIQTLEERIAELESNPSLEVIAEGVQNWINTEFVKKVEQLIEDSKTVTESATIDTDALAERIQKWVIEEYSPEVENWTKTEFAKYLAEGVQKWMIEDYSQELQNWIVEELTPCIDTWTKEQIKESLENSKKASLSSIDETLALLESAQAQKPKYGRKQILESKNEENDEPKFIRDMPADKRVKWDLCTEAVKDSIIRRAKLYNFINEGAIEKFWEGINFDEVKPAQTIYEGLDSIQDEREKSIRMSLRRFANR